MVMTFLVIRHNLLWWNWLNSKEPKLCVQRKGEREPLGERERKDDFLPPWTRPPPSPLSVRKTSIIGLLQFYLFFFHNTKKIHSTKKIGGGKFAEVRRKGDRRSRSCVADPLWPQCDLSDWTPFHNLSRSSPASWSLSSVSTHVFRFEEIHMWCLGRKRKNRLVLNFIIWFLVPILFTGFWGKWVFSRIFKKEESHTHTHFTVKKHGRFL